MILRMLVFILGAFTAGFTLSSAVRSFVLPRSAPDPLARLVFIGSRLVFRLFTLRANTYLARDRILAVYAPVTLLVLLPVWLVLVWLGYAGMYWSLGIANWSQALQVSGSSLLTLGFAQAQNFGELLLVFSEATLGLMLVAVLIAYLPTMYSAFSRREAAVAKLEIRAGSPPSAEEMFARYHRLGRLQLLSEVWITWEEWFTDLEESHTSLTALVFFRSPQPDRSWITAAGAVLDAASLAASSLDLPRDAQQDLTIRAGYIALRRIADFFRITYNPHPLPGDPIHVTRQEFDGVLDRLAVQGVPIKPDREQAWKDFAGWRVNYDSVLISLAYLVSAPEAPWSSDRAGDLHRPWYIG